MLKKGKIIKGKSELQKSKSFEDFQSTKDLVSKKSFHNTDLMKSRVTTNYDFITIQQMDFKDTLKITNYDVKKGEEIAKDIKEFAIVEKSYKLTTKTFKMALRHYCFYDIIEEDENKVTIIFLPISTSDSTVLCSIQKFDKIHIYNNDLKDFYITRLLFQKTMNRLDYENWVNKNQYEGDVNVRKLIFEKIQQDLDVNQYSIIKDTDIIQPKAEFFEKELPLIKYKFTDLEL